MLALYALCLLFLLNITLLLCVLVDLNIVMLTLESALCKLTCIQKSVELKPCLTISYIQGKITPCWAKKSYYYNVNYLLIVSQR